MSTVLYHCTYKQNVGAIKRWGIIPRDTSKHNYPGMQYEQGHVERVYASETPWFWGTPAIDYVCVAFDATGLTMEDDPVLKGPARRVHERITPDRIIAIHKSFDTLPCPPRDYTW